MNLSVWPHTKETCLKALDDLGLKTSTVEHEPVFRVQDGLDKKSHTTGAHTKNLFVRDDKQKQFLISAEQSTVISLKSLPNILRCGRLSFGSPERLWRALGVTPGSVSAFALLNDAENNVHFVLDKKLDEAEFVNFHPLLNDATTQISKPDFKKFLRSIGREAHIIDFSAIDL